jgi:hypothetical protein
VKKRLREDRNTMSVSLGPPRSGKSESQKTLGGMCKLASLGPFKAKDVTFLPQDYLDRLRSGQPGDYAVFDEPGAEWGNRNFASIENKMLNATHITMGSKLVNVGWAVPVLLMQDKVSRMLVNFTFIFRGSGPKGIGKFYQNWVDPFTGKTGRVRLGMVWFARAFQDQPEEARLYDEMKKQYQEDRYRKYYEDFAKGDDENAEKVKEVEELRTKVVVEIMEDPTPYLKELGNKIGKTDLAALIGQHYPELKGREPSIVAGRVLDTLRNRKAEESSKPRAVAK